jgi:hypothetical protein
MRRRWRVLRRIHGRVLGHRRRRRRSGLGRWRRRGHLRPLDLDARRNVGELGRVREGEVVRGRNRPVVIEVTEHTAIQDYAALREALHACGPVKVSVDDAGAGFSSLRHILELEPDVVKLDIGLIQGIDRDLARQALAAGLRHYAQRTGTLLIADGARFEGSAVSGGTTFSCALNASSADATTAGFTVPTNCDLVASPADGCTYKVTVNTASATRNGNSIEGTVNGRLNKSCTGGSSTATDFSMTIVGMR